MAQYDPAMRKETLLFQEVGRQGRNTPVYKQLPYVLVSYDGDPVQVLEPLPVDTRVRSNDAANTAACRVIDPVADGLGRVEAVRFFTSRPYEVFGYNDVDAANNLL